LSPADRSWTTGRAEARLDTRIGVLQLLVIASFLTTEPITRCRI
jgi:hypothetical protein